MRQDSSITEIKGIGEKTKKLFEKMGVYTVGDILLHFPRNYIQYPHPVPIDEMTAEHTFLLFRYHIHRDNDL